MLGLFEIFIAAVIVQNVVLAGFLGVCPLLGVSKKRGAAVGMGLAVMFVMLMTASITFAIYHLVLVEFDLSFMRTVVFIMIMATMVQFVEMVIKKFFPPLYKSLGAYLPLITTNCAAIGTVLLNIDRGFDFREAMVNTLGVAVGFLLVIYVFSTIRERLELSLNIPKGFKGVPIALIVTGIMAITFMGFMGMGA